MKKYIAMVLAAATVLSGCSSMSKLASGLLLGAGSGAAAGAAVGAAAGKDAKSAAIGAAIGTAVGAAAGAIIGKQMDKKAAELKALEDAKVETFEDANGLKGVKVTFASGILFKTNSSTLSAESKEALTQFAAAMKDLPETDITVYGHTDNTGTYEVNQKVSNQRAQSVAKFLKSHGIDGERIATEGKAYDLPVASNDTEEGRAQNRRVEIYVSANEKMIEEAIEEAK